MMLVDTSDWKCLMKIALLIDDVPVSGPGVQNVHGISIQVAKVQVGEISQCSFSPMLV
jgi:hypothetical protein